jgi:HSP20 family protein
VARFFIETRQDHDDIRRLVRLLDEAGDEGAGQAECAPPVDVVEHQDRVEITVDLPGVARAALRVLFAKGTLVIAGRKLPHVCSNSVAFHLAERRFGRFVRAVRVSGALDAGRATASLNAGELRVVLPRIEERRGREIHIDVTGG